jgi:DNA-binding beta-propeller fold protein YncE
VFKSDGAFVKKWRSEGSGDGQLIYPFGISIGCDGLVYVTDCSNSRIQVFESDGTFVSKWGSDGSDDGQFSNPWGLLSASFKN